MSGFDKFTSRSSQGAFGSGIVAGSVELGITAHVGQIQGGSPATKSTNYISTVGTAGDSVTAISAFVGAEQEFVNEGTKALALFPALGDDIGAGVNASIPLGPGATIRIKAKDDTTWKVMA